MVSLGLLKGLVGYILVNRVLESVFVYVLVTCTVHVMGNKCATPCNSSTPSLKNRIRCLYFCCLSGASINVIHQHPTVDELDCGQRQDKEIDSVSVYIETTATKRRLNGGASEDSDTK
jgi:hypothetical protein